MKWWIMTFYLKLLVRSKKEYQYMEEKSGKLWGRIGIDGFKFMVKTFPTLCGDELYSGTHLDVDVKSISFNTISTL
jgi:hypothetical protein